MKIIECDQYSLEWWQARRGIPTASEFSRIFTPKTMKLSAGAEGYIAELLGDRADPEYPRMDGPETRCMRNGLQMEPEARSFYELERGVTVQQVGFCLSDCGRYGASPDALVGKDGALELKNPLPKTQVSYLLNGGLPDEYKAQVHGHLIVTGRQWCDFLSYSPGLPPLLIRVTPDEYTEKLRAALHDFYQRYQAAERIIFGAAKEVVTV